jgi:hypothetical protein
MVSATLWRPVAITNTNTNKIVEAMRPRKHQREGDAPSVIIGSAPTSSALRVLSQTNMCDLISSWLERVELASLLPVCKAITVSDVAWEMQCARFPLIRLVKEAADDACFGARQPFR